MSIRVKQPLSSDPRESLSSVDKGQFEFVGYDRGLQWVQTKDGIPERCEFGGCKPKEEIPKVGEVATVAAEEPLRDQPFREELGGFFWGFFGFKHEYELWECFAESKLDTCGFLRCQIQAIETEDLTFDFIKVKVVESIRVVDATSVFPASEELARIASEESTRETRRSWFRSWFKSTTDEETKARPIFDSYAHELERSSVETRKDWVYYSSDSQGHMGYQMLIQLVDGNPHLVLLSSAGCCNSNFMYVGNMKLSEKTYDIIQQASAD